MTNFDLVPSRRRTNSVKWLRYPKDVLPMWVADMDFPAPAPIRKKLRWAAEHGVLGYDFATPRLKEIVAARMDRLYGWQVEPDAVVDVTGIVSGFSVAARIACSPKRGILLQTPVYNEFHEVKNNLGIPQLDAPFARRVEGNILRYEIDWDIFEKQVKKAGMFLLCSPHNPLGIIFSRSELKRMAELCIQNGALIVSDEIHSELLLGGSAFTPMAKLSPEIARHTITLVSPSKTFNVPGLFCGFAIVPDERLRQRYRKEAERLRMHVNSMGLYAAEAAFSGSCDGWLAELRRYLTANRDFLAKYLGENMPAALFTIPDATYLGWLDFRGTKIEGSPYQFFLKNARVALSEGRIFGEEGAGHVRLNFGAPRKTLAQGLERMRKALERA